MYLGDRVADDYRCRFRPPAATSSPPGLVLFIGIYPQHSSIRAKADAGRGCHIARRPDTLRFE